jgi:hypothetical protein
MGARIINADWDEEAGVWVATSDDIIGLVTEAETLEELRDKLADLVPELIRENGLPDGVDPMAPVEVVARPRLSIRAA